MRVGREEFVKLQEYYIHPQASPAPVVLLRYSQTLRMHLDAAILDLESRLDALTLTSTPAATTAELEQFLWSAKQASMVWHLSEIMALDASSFAYIPMVAWVYQHFPRLYPEQLAAQSKDVQAKGSQSSAFWPLVVYFVLRGDLPTAWAHLRHHAKFRSLAATPERREDELVKFFLALKAVMHTMPRLEDAEIHTPGLLSSDLAKRLPANLKPAGPPREVVVEAHENSEEQRDEWLNAWDEARVSTERVVEFKARWAEWSRRVAGLSEEFGSLLKVEKDLQELVQIMRGDIDAVIRALPGESDSWAHVLAACLLYSAPSSHKSEFAELANSCMEFREKIPEKPLVMAVLSGDFLQALQHLHARSGDKWVCAHLAELLCRAEVVEAVSLKSTPPLDKRFFQEADFMLADLEMDAREFFLIDYAVQLGIGGYQPYRQAHAPINWRFAVDYLARCERLVPLSASIQPTNFRSPTSTNSIHSPYTEASSSHTLSNERGIKTYGMQGQALAMTGQADEVEESVVRLGRAYAYLVVDCQFPLNDRFVSKLAFGCKRLGLADLAKSLERERAMHWWCHAGGRHKYMASNASSQEAASSFGGVANALLWAAKSGEGFAERLVRFLFEHGSIEALKAVVDHISPTIDTGLKLLDLDVHALRFLAAYKAIRACLEEASAELNNEFSISNQEPDTIEGKDDAWTKRDEACRVFCQTLRETDVPERFRLPILREILLWEMNATQSENVVANPPLISIEDCTLLMQCIEQLEVSLKQQVLVKEFRPESDLAAIRLMLTQALSRSVILTGVYAKQVV